MTIIELLGLSLEGRYNLSIYWEMRRGLWRIIRKKLSKKKVNIKDRPHIPKEKIRSIFKELKVYQFDTVFIHSGISNIGVIEGGRKAVFDLLKEVIDITKGNLLFPTFSFFPRMYDYLESYPVFDVRNTPSYMGTLTQYALKSDMGLRSIDPTHSVLAIGRDAELIVCDHYKDKTPFGPNSPFQRFLEFDNSKILLLGVSTDAITIVHAIEDMLGEKFPIVTYTKKIYEIECIKYSGEHIKTKTRCHTPVLSLSRDITRFNKLMREIGAVIQEIPIGNSCITLINARKFSEKLLDLVRQGKTIYGKCKKKIIISGKI